MKNVLRGGAFAIVADDSEQAMANDHPEGTWLPPAGSDMVSGPSMMG